MKCIAGIHYDVVRRREGTPGREYDGDIRALHCKFCSFSIYKHLVAKPRSSKSGLGRYNRMRGYIVKHLHEQHGDELIANELRG